MRKQPEGGHIFNMIGAGSDGASTPQYGAYGATKAGHHLSAFISGFKNCNLKYSLANEGSTEMLECEGQYILPEPFTGSKWCTFHLHR